MGRWKDLAEDAREARFGELVSSGMTEEEAIDAMNDEEERRLGNDPS